MPGIFFILIMVLLVTLWIMGAYVDVKNTHRQNSHQSPHSTHKTEIVEKSKENRKDTLKSQNIAKENVHTMSREERAMDMLPFIIPHASLFMPAHEKKNSPPTPESPAPEPVPFDIPRYTNGNGLLRREDDFLSPLPQEPENSVPLTEEPIMETLATCDASIQANPEKRDAGTGDPLLAQDTQVQVTPEKRDAGTGNAYTAVDAAIQVAPEKEDQSIQVLPSRHDVSLGSHISQHEQGVQHDLSTHSIGIDPSRSPVEEKSIQVLQSLRDVSLQNSLAQESKGVGSHVSYSSKEIEANPEQKDQSVQVSFEERHPVTGFSRLSGIVISGMSELDISLPSDPEPIEQHWLDKMPLAQSILIENVEEADSHHSRANSRKEVNQTSLEYSLAQSVLVPWKDLREETKQQTVKSTPRSPSKKSSDGFEVISSPKHLRPRPSWDLLEDEEK